MFSGLFKPQWQHKKADIRIRAVQQLNPADAENQQIMMKLAKGDCDPGVRAAACSGLTDLTVLDQLANGTSDDNIKNAANRQINQLLAGEYKHGPSLENRLRLIDLSENQSVLEYIALNSPDDSCRTLAISRMDNQEALLSIALSNAHVDVLLAACNRLNSESDLRQVIKQVNNKRVQRQARDNLKQVLSRSEQQNALNKLANQLRENLTWLNAHSSDPLFEGRLHQAELQWQQLKSHDNVEMISDLGNQLSNCLKIHDEQLQVQQQQQASAEAKIEFSNAISDLENLRKQLSSEHWQQPQSLRTAITLQQTRWQAAQELASPESHEAKRFDQLLTNWQRALELCSETNLNNDIIKEWPNGFAYPTHWQYFIEQQQAEFIAKEKAQKQQHKDQARVLSQLDRALNGRRLKQANRAIHQLEEQLGDAFTNSHWQRKLEKRFERLNELRDWHNFAAEPKKVALCESMEDLISSPLEPEDQSNAIQALHDEWKALMSADQDADQQLWDRFKKASDTAWEPCAEHFKQLDRIRSDNLKKRQQLIAQLEEYMARMDWDHANWQAVLDVRINAPKEFKSYDPINFTEARELNKTFSHILKALDDKLDNASNENKKALEKLIKDAEELAKLEDKFSSADDSKSLQQQWKRTGWVRSRDYHKLNRKFRSIIDGIFSERSQLIEQQQAEKDKKKDQQKEIINSLCELLESSNDQLDVSAIQQQLDLLTNINKELESNSEPSKAKPKPYKAKKTETEVEQQARNRLKLLPEWRRWKQLQEKLDQLPEGEIELEKQKQLAVALECVTDTNSPESAQAERTQWQLQNLSSSMTGGKKAPFSACQEYIEKAELTQLTPDIKARMLTCIKKLEPQAN